MTVKELIDFLQKFNPDLEVIHTRCSDYEIIEESMWSIQLAIPRTDKNFLIRYHPSLPIQIAKEYLHLEGN